MVSIGNEWSHVTWSFAVRLRLIKCNKYSKIYIYGNCVLKSHISVAKQCALILGSYKIVYVRNDPFIWTCQKAIQCLKYKI